MVEPWFRLHVDGPMVLACAWIGSPIRLAHIMGGVMVLAWAWMELWVWLAYGLRHDVGLHMDGRHYLGLHIWVES